MSPSPLATLHDVGVHDLGPKDVERPALRTFKPRRRRGSPGRDALMARMSWAILPEEGDVLDLIGVFGTDRPVVLDIGFGGGQELIDIAQTRPHEAVIGVEVHTPGVARVLSAIEEGATHVRVVHGDALIFLERLPYRSLHGVRIFFPDPWPKHRQRDRRLVQPTHIAALVERLVMGGTLHLATDVADYANQMQDICAADTRLVGGPVPRPDWRAETRFERRGLDEGRASIDLLYRRVA